MDKACILAGRRKVRRCSHLGVIHDDGITLGMSAAVSVSVHGTVKELIAVLLCHRTVYYVAAAAVSV